MTDSEERVVVLWERQRERETALTEKICNQTRVIYIRPRIDRGKVIVGAAPIRVVPSDMATCGHRRLPPLSPCAPDCCPYS